MIGMRRVFLSATFLAAAIVASEGVTTALQQAPPAQQKPVREPDIFWVPTPDAVVTGMLKLANVSKDDVVYDLGCGDGKIVIAAAQQFGARGVGIDIDPKRIEESNANAKKAGVADRVQFILGDIFDTNVKISDATVVTLYLLPSLNDKLQPRLKSELKPGARVVSHSFAMTDWTPDKSEQADGRQIYLWTIPKR
jgi:cyclopropane fatty-acyl-phospholipid synthase-like methyltransferase